MKKVRKKLALRKFSISKLTPEAAGALVGGPPSRTDCTGYTVTCSQCVTTSAVTCTTD